MTAALVAFGFVGWAAFAVAALAMIAMLGRVNRAERIAGKTVEKVMRQSARIAHLERAAIDRELVLEETRQDLAMQLEKRP